ncbi:MAG: hypothetical protein IJS26_04645 [Alphaproteobacteria bacterium]|nr:hypothetical protein [Alphaproteobacteria bacterium]
MFTDVCLRLSGIEHSTVGRGHQAKKQPLNVVFCADGDSLLFCKGSGSNRGKKLQTECPKRACPLDRSRLSSTND